MSVSLGRAAGSQAGSSLVELALTLPLLVLVLVGTTDFARVFYTAIELTNASRAGAQYGATSLIRSGQIDVMRATAIASVNVTGINADAGRLCQCANDAGTSFFATSGSVNNCTSPVAISCPSGHRVMTVTVTTTKTFTTIAPYPGIPTSIALTRAATFRVTE